MTERRADEASRDVESWLKCYYMQDHVGEEFAGTVSGVTSFGIFVGLDGVYVEGLVHISELGADYFQYDAARHQIRGERTGKSFRLADRVRVRIARVDLATSRIDFVSHEGRRAIFGFHAVLARLRAQPASVIAILLDESRNDARVRDVVAAAERAGVVLHRVPAKRLDGFYGGGRHQGSWRVSRRRTCGQASTTCWTRWMSPAPPRPRRCHRSAQPRRLPPRRGRRRVHAVVAPKDRSAGLSATVMKVASGAADTVPFFPVTNLARTLNELKERSIWIVGTDGEAPQDLYAAELRPPLHGSWDRKARECAA